MPVEEVIQDQLTPEKLVADYVHYKASKLSGRSIANANWVTTLAHECEAYGVYMRTVPPEKRRRMKESLGMIFSEGDDQARAIKRDLLDMSYEVEGAEGQVSWPKFQITGRKDLRIRKIGVRHGISTEVKSCSPFTYDSIKTAEDIRTHKWTFIRKWFHQVALYMVLQGEERYWLLLKNKSTGQIKIIEFTLGDEEWAAADVMTKKAERINEFVQIGKMPTPEMKISTPDLCTECEFFDTCLPEMNMGMAAKILTDELASELAMKTARLMELKPLSKEYEELDEEIKEQIKALTVDGEENVVYGDWVAYVKNIQIKAQPEKKVPAKEAYIQRRITFTNVAPVPAAPEDEGYRSRNFDPK